MLRGLTDFEPWGLTDEQLRVWRKNYAKAKKMYGQRWASHVADTLNQTMWLPSGARRRMPSPGRLPFLGDIFHIGYLLDVNYYDGSTIRTKVYPLVDLWWSKSKKAAVAFPRMRFSTPTRDAEEFPSLLREYRKWHDGKPPKAGVGRFRYEDWPFVSVYPCVAESYRSDKFERDYEYVDWIHHHHRGRGRSAQPMVHFGPNCVMIRGGRLELTSGGLIN